MKRLLLILTTLLIIGAPVFSNEVIHIAPFYDIDEVKDEVKTNSNYHKKLYEKLQGIETGIHLSFSTTSSGRGENPPQSLAEAIRVCQNEKANYLLYGYIATRDRTIYAEIKLLDYGKRTLLRTFYSVDDHENLDRLLSDLKTKITAFIEEAFSIVILEKEAEFTEWWVYGRLGYWTPIGADWLKLMIGTGAADFGVRFIPTDCLKVTSGYSVFASVSLEASYLFGLGNPQRYKAYDHIIAIGLPLKLHLRLNAQHGISGGVGLLYQYDLLFIKMSYEDGKLLPYSSFGASAFLGYAFRIRENFLISADNRFDLQGYDSKVQLSYSLRLGLDYRFSKKETVRKWQ